MTDTEIAALRPEQVLIDGAGREWTVLHEPRTDDGTHWVMIRSGRSLARRLTYQNSADLRIQPSANPQ